MHARMAAAILFASLCLSGFSPSEDDRLPAPSPRPASGPAPMIIGHRGLGKAHAPEPENGVEALVAALERGAEAVELDVQLTADGEVVLAHDEELRRISDGEGCVAEKTLAELRTLSLRDGSGTVHPGRHVATLREALRAIAPFTDPRRRFVADVHVKVYDGFRGDVGGPSLCPITDWRRLTWRVFTTLRDEAMLRSVLVTSFDIRVLERLRRFEPSSRVGLLALLNHGAAIRKALAKRFEAVVLPGGLAPPSEVRSARDAGLAVYQWFPEEESERDERQVLASADGLISDRLDAAARVRASLSGDVGRER